MSAIRSRLFSTRLGLERLEDRAVPAAFGVIPDPAGEVLVNTTIDGRLEAPKVVADTAGNTVVVWSGPDANERGVYARRFDAQNRPLGGEFRVNQTTAGRQSQALVGMDAAGNFVVVWSGNGPRDSSGVFARRYAADGRPLGGEFRVNSTTAGEQSEIALAMNARGELVVAWDSYDRAGNYLGVYAQRFGAGRAPAGGEFRVNAVTSGTQGMPKVAINSGGEFVVTWVSNPTGGADREVYGQRFGAAGERVGAEFRVNPTVSGRQEMGAVGIDDFGRVVAVFIGLDAGYEGVYVQRFDAAGTRVGGEVRVNTTVDSRQVHPWLSVEPDGDFTIAWTSSNSIWTEADTYIQRFTADGTRVGTETRMNAAVAGRQFIPGLVLTAAGGVVVWEGAGPGDADGVFLRRFGVSADGFQIALRTTGLTASQRAIFQQAADRWAEVITGDLPDATFNGAFVDDLLIDASVLNIDGVGGILGSAGPDRLRSDSLLPLHGVMQFERADIDALEADGGLYSVVLHEIGHVLGIGTLWALKGLLTGAGTSNPTFTGAQATAAYNQVFGTSATGVPVEDGGGPGTQDSHWRESVFDSELMTGFLDPGVNELSRVTVASLADLGYQVNLNAADGYTP